MAARTLHEPGTCLQVDHFEWKHPVLNLHVLQTIMVDAGSRAASVTIHRVMDTEHGLGNVKSEIMLATLLNHWVKYHGKPDIVRTDPEGAFGDQGFVKSTSPDTENHDKNGYAKLYDDKNLTMTNVDTDNSDMTYTNKHKNTEYNVRDE